MQTLRDADMPVSKKEKKNKTPVIAGTKPNVNKTARKPHLTEAQHGGLMDRLLKDKDISRAGVQLGVIMLLSSEFEQRIESDCFVCHAQDELDLSKEQFFEAWSALVARGYVQETSRGFEDYNAEELEEYGDDKSLILTFRWLV